MRILALDTSNEICSVAVLEDEELIKENYSDGKEQHSVNLMPMIKATLEDANLSLDDIDLLACGIGPGSFTGVRIGIATVKAFSDAKNIPIVSVNSLEAQSYNVLLKKGKANCKIVSMIDARNDNAYCAVYKVHNGNLSIYKNPESMKIANICEYINYSEPVYVVGNVAKDKLANYFEIIKANSEEEKQIRQNVEYIDSHEPMAKAIGISALDKYKKGLYGNSESILPMYLQKPQAERQKEGDYVKINITEASENDLGEIKSNYEKFPNIWNKKAFEETINTCNYIIAKSKQEIVGFIGIKEIADETEIMNIVIREDKRNYGIATEILSYIIRKYEDKKINLEVNEHNKIAKDLYLKLGFNQVGTRKNYYQDGGDAILMSLD